MRARVDLFFYLENASPLHRLHPVTKIALLGGSCAVGLVLARPLHLLAAGAVLLVALALHVVHLVWKHRNDRGADVAAPEAATPA